MLVNAVDYCKDPINMLLHLWKQALVFRAVIPVFRIPPRCELNNYDAIEGERFF